MSASRSARRSPPTALSSRTIARAAASSSVPALAGTQLHEALERRSRAPAAAATGRGATICRAISRASTSVRAPRSARRCLDRSVRRCRELRRPTSPRSPRSRAGRCARGRGARRAQEGRAPRGTRAAPQPGSPRRGSRPRRRARARFESFLPSSPRSSPWWIDLGELAAERPGDPALRLLVRAMVGAADDVRDAEVEVVGDGRELVGRASRRRGASVTPSSRSEPSASRAAPPSRSARCRRRGVDAAALALAHRPLVPGDPEPVEVVEDRLLAAARRARGSVSSIRSTSAPPRSSANRRFATAVSALPRWSDPVGLGAKRTRTLTRRSGRGPARPQRDRARLGSPDTTARSKPPSCATCVYA